MGLGMNGYDLSKASALGSCHDGQVRSDNVS